MSVAVNTPLTLTVAGVHGEVEVDLAGDPVVIRSSLSGPGWRGFSSDGPSGDRDFISHFDDHQSACRPHFTRPDNLA